MHACVRAYEQSRWGVFRERFLGLAPLPLVEVATGMPYSVLARKRTFKQPPDRAHEEDDEEEEWVSHPLALAPPLGTKFSKMIIIVVCCLVLFPFSLASCHPHDCTFCV